MWDGNREYNKCVAWKKTLNNAPILVKYDTSIRVAVDGDKNCAKKLPTIQTCPLSFYGIHWPL
jgi:hypothetical protein